MASSCVIENGLLYHHTFPKGKYSRNLILKRLAVPKILRDDLMKSYHDSMAGGCHQGIDRTHAAMRQKYYWKSMFGDLKIYIDTCRACQQNKKHNQTKPTPLHPIPHEDIFHRWHMDLLGPFKKASNFHSSGFQYVLVVVDSYSKWFEAFPMKTLEAAEVAQHLYQDIICRYGAPHTIVTDRGSNFISKLVKELCKIFQITKYETSSYHPQTNANVERLNSVILNRRYGCTSIKTMVIGQISWQVS